MATKLPDYTEYMLMTDEELREAYFHMLPLWLAGEITLEEVKHRYEFTEAVRDQRRAESALELATRQVIAANVVVKKMLVEAEAKKKKA